MGHFLMGQVGVCWMERMGCISRCCCVGASEDFNFAVPVLKYLSMHKVIKNIISRRPITAVLLCALLVVPGLASATRVCCIANTAPVQTGAPMVQAPANPCHGVGGARAVVDADTVQAAADVGSAFSADCGCTCAVSAMVADTPIQKSPQPLFLYRRLPVAVPNNITVSPEIKPPRQS